MSSVTAFLESRLGFDPRQGMGVGDWLSLSGQAVLEVVAGPVFVDRSGELTTVRRALKWYPDDIWRCLLACDWGRIAQELPLMERAADVGDETGSLVIAARVAHIAADPEVRALRPGLGSVEQVTDNVDLLTDPRSRRMLASWLSSRPLP